MPHSIARRLIVPALSLALLLAGTLAAAAGRPATAAGAGRSRGVVLLPAARGLSVASLRAGDQPVLAGLPVTVLKSDARVGALVASADLPDADLARALNAGGLAAEVNQIRQILPVTPTAELFNRPLAMAPADRRPEPDFWHVAEVGADLVQAAGQVGDKSTVVAVVDTGVDIKHKLLAGALLPGVNFVDGSLDVADQVGHGTHVAGIVHSICPKCGIMPLKVLDTYGGDDYTIARGILYAQQRGARVVQISLGGSSPSAVMCRAIDSVVQAGALVVIAAGNSSGSSVESIGYPGSCNAGALLVSSTNRYNVPSWFSNYGPAVDIAAPGEAVWSSVPASVDADGFLPASGTSMAAPMVSGAAGLLWSANPTWSAQQIRDRLVATARDVSTLPGIDDGYGPRLDVAQAFGLRARPIVVGVFADKPWVPKAGGDAERTIRVQARVRGDALTSVRLNALVAGTTQQITMTLQSGDLYAADFVAPPNAGALRDIYLQPVAVNSAGAGAGYREVVMQEGGPVSAPTIELLSRSLYPMQPIQFRVDWGGTWNNYDFACGDYVHTVFAVSRGQVVTCAYASIGIYAPVAIFYADDVPRVSTGGSLEIIQPRPQRVPFVLFGRARR